MQITRTIVGIILLVIGLGAFYLNVVQLQEEQSWLKERVTQTRIYGSLPQTEPKMRGGSTSDIPRNVAAPQPPSWITEFVENLNADRVLNWVANIVTIITGVLLILRRRRED